MHRDRIPPGATSTESKAFEAQKALRDGATEVDMVINVGGLKSRDYELVERTSRRSRERFTPGGAILKVIIEAALLTDEEKGRRLPAGQGRRRGLRQDFHRIRARRCDRGGRGVDATRGGKRDGSEGVGRHPELCGCEEDDRRGRQPHRREREREDRSRSRLVR